MGRRGFLVPRLRFEPVAHDLFVERRRTHAGAVLISRPETRRIRRKDFVDQKEFAAVVSAKLELGIRDDDAAGFGESRSFAIELNRVRTYLRGKLGADDFFGFGKRNVLVVL